MNTGLPKIKMSGKGTFVPPITPLTKDSKLGDHVFWDSTTRSYNGVLVEWDSNVAIVKLGDGTIKAIET